MKFIPLDSRHKHRELPVKIQLSFGPLVEQIENTAKDVNDPTSAYYSSLLHRIDQYPELRAGIENFDDFEKYGDLLEILIKPLFPDLLQSNEIKAMILPFIFHIYHPSKRFAKILENAGSELDLRFYGYEADTAYTYVCSYIMKFFYGQPILGFDRPIYIDIPNQNTGKLHHYRVMYNVDNLEIIKTETAPELTNIDFAELINNKDDLALWKEKFPPNSYLIKGFTIINFFDVTQAVLVSKTRSLFLRKDEKVFVVFQEYLKDLYGIEDLLVGMSTYNTVTKVSLNSIVYEDAKSLFLKPKEEKKSRSFFCDDIQMTVLKKHEVYTIIDVDHCGKQKLQLTFYKRLKKRGIKCISLVPIKINEEHLQILEIASVRKHELGALSEDKLKDIVPYIKIAFERIFEERKNSLESTIQENYTSIHPTVKWRFVEAATNLNAQKSRPGKPAVSEKIVFEEVYPLYGQCDIKGSSEARNRAIQADLELQLTLLTETFQKILKIQNFPICKELSFKVNGYLETVKKGLKTDDEFKLLDFLKKEIYPALRALRDASPELKNTISPYFSNLTPKQKVIFKQRKDYETSVTLLNEKLSGLIDDCQEEAQKMFPHYFERFKTDGVDFNIYIGDSLVKGRKFKEIHLQNLRLWQLKTMCQLEQLASHLEKEMPYPLRIASLILVHSKPLAIRFRMDEKQFDVDGAHNVHYAIVRKRIDKSYIKGTTERLTQPGKIAIVYSDETISKEYQGYINYLQSEKQLGKVELLELEDMQDLSGLKAIRVEVVYKNKLQSQRKVTVKSRNDSL